MGRHSGLCWLCRHQDPAKLANHCAKKGLAGEDCVCDFTHGVLTSYPDSSALQVDEVWGVGRKRRSDSTNVALPKSKPYAHLTPRFCARNSSVVLERSPSLNGVILSRSGRTCPGNKQQIMSSRSFGQYVHELERLKQVASYMAIAAAETAQPKTHAGIVCVSTHQSVCRASAAIPTRTQCPVAEPSDDTLRLTKVALWLLKKIYRPGYAYQKAGVALMDLRDAGTTYCFNLFATNLDNPRLMQAMDHINAVWGPGKLRSAAEGVRKEWSMKREKKSPNYTTRWGTNCRRPVKCADVSHCQRRQQSDRVLRIDECADFLASLKYRTGY